MARGIHLISSHSHRLFTMDLMTLWKLEGRQAILAFCDRVGTNYDYFKHMAHDRKRPGVDLALRMINDPLGKDRLTLTELLKPREQLRRRA
jgi:hypothetical protein